ncbi:MAG: response regulator, partial [Chthoniobacterales bacterium]
VPLDKAELPVDASGKITEPVLDGGFANHYPLSILVVEDDKVNLKLILSLIRRLGYEPIFAKNGREAVDIQKREHTDCVLMDLQMPEMDGIEATEKIRAIEKECRSEKPTFISALTANIFPADRQRCFDVGMNGYLNKPLKLAMLARLLIQAEDFAASRRR